MILSCLAKDPDDRIQSAADLLASVEAMESDKQWRNQDAVRWWDTHIPAAPAAAHGTTRI